MKDGVPERSRAPDRCHYCGGDDPDCGFCEQGVPLDTQEDWDASWGSLLSRGRRLDS